MSQMDVPSRYNATMASYKAAAEYVMMGPVPEFDTRPMYQWSNENRWVAPTAAIILYLLAIFVVLPKVRPEKTTVAKHGFAAWNLFLSAFSWCGVVVCVPFMYRHFMDGGVWHLVCDDKMMFGTRDTDAASYGSMGFMMTLFMLSKFPELCDTVFLVWMKKPVSFLHWYHHCSVLAYTWFAYIHVTPTAPLFGTVNYTVHSIMYFYFGAACYTKKLSFLRMPITSMQLAQMVIGVAMTVAAYYYENYSPRGCSQRYLTTNFYPFCAAMYGSYLVLFAKLFVDNYITKKPKRKVDAKAVKAE